MQFASFAVAACAFVATGAFGAWPDKPIRMIVAVPPAGPADTLSRLVSPGLTAALGQPIVIDNKPGAGSNVGSEYAARQPSDGYTLFLAEVGPNAVSHALAKVPYDPHTAFTPIIHAVNLPAVILIRPDLPYTTLAEFIDHVLAIKTFWANYRWFPPIPV